MALKSKLLLCGLAALLPTLAAAACTETQAFDKMMALGRAQSRLMAGSSDQVKKGTALTIDTANVGKTLADKKYDEACRQYDEIAQRHHIDLGQEQTGMVTMDKLKADGGRAGGSCSQADAMTQLMTMTERLQTRARRGEVPQAAVGNFATETSKMSELVYTDPSAFCRKLDQLRPKYGL